MRRGMLIAAAMLIVALASGCTPPSAPTPAPPSSGQASGQGAPIEFRVVASGQNPSACRQFDAALSRVHTITPAGATATLRTAGGISSTMTQTAPGIFTTTLGIGGVDFDVVADTSKSPKTLDVTRPTLGCRWTAVAP